MSEIKTLTPIESGYVAELLSIRANELAHWNDTNRNNDTPKMILDSCSREIERLRYISDKLVNNLPKCPTCGNLLSRHNDHIYHCDDCGYFNVELQNINE